MIISSTEALLCMRRSVDKPLTLLAGVANVVELVDRLFVVFAAIVSATGCLFAVRRHSATADEI